MKKEWENLLNAVVAQAAKDYRSACKKLRKKPEDKAALKLKRETEDFFTTDRVRLYTHYSGVRLLHMLEEEQAEIDRQEELKKLEEQKALEELKAQEELNERERIAGTVQPEDESD